MPRLTDVEKEMARSASLFQGDVWGSVTKEGDLRL